MSLPQPYTLLTLPPELRLQIYALLLPNATPIISSSPSLSVPLSPIEHPNESPPCEIQLSDPAYPKQSSVISLLHCSRQTRAELYPLLSVHHLLDEQGRLAWKLDCKVDAEDMRSRYGLYEEDCVSAPAVYLHPLWTQFPGVSRFIPSLEVSISLATGINDYERWIFMFCRALELLERYVNYGPAFGTEEIEGEEVVGFNIGTLVLNLEYKLYTEDDPLDVGRTLKVGGLNENARLMLFRKFCSRVRASEVLKSLKKRVRKFCIKDGESGLDRCYSGENNRLGEVQ